MLLTDRIAVVAGGSKGIGRAVSARLAAEGATVIVVARDRLALDDSVASLRAAGARASGFAADCSRRGQVDAVVDAVSSEFGGVDILVNTIGGGVPELLLSTSDELFDDMLNHNVRTAFLLSRAFAGAMVKRGAGKIVHTSSIGAKTPTPGLSVYDGCKAFLVAFTRDLAMELGQFQINVNCVCPGHIPTEATAAVGRKLVETTGIPAAQLEAMVKSRMAIHRFPTVDEIAELYLFLVSPAADCMTGQAINYSCGMEMR